MGKKKKKAQLGAWADDDAGEEFTPAPRGKAGRRQMSRKQQRRGAAAWAEGSDGEDLPAQTPAPAAKPPQPDLRLPLSDLEGACNAHEQPSATGKLMTPRSGAQSNMQRPSGLLLPSPEAFAAALARSSGSSKAFGPPLRYPSCDNSPQVSARLQELSPSLSARLASGQEAAKTSPQQPSEGHQFGNSSGNLLSMALKSEKGSRLQDASGLALAHASNSGKKEAEQEGGNGISLQQQRQPQLGATFAVLADSVEEVVSENELEAFEEQPDRSTSSSLQAVDSTAPSFSFGGASAGPFARPAQAGSPFSFAAGSGSSSPADPSPQKPAPHGHSRFAFAVGSPPASAPAASPFGPASSQLNAQQDLARPLFSFAAMAAAASPTAAAALGLQRAQQAGSSSAASPPAAVGGAAPLPAALSPGSSEEDAFFSAVQSRATSAALTAYASAISLSRSGGDSPTRSSAATPLRPEPADPAEAAELCSNSVAAAVRADADAAPATAPRSRPPMKDPPSVLERLQQTAQKLSAAAQAEAGAAEGSQEAGKEEDAEELAEVESQAQEQSGWAQVPAPALQPSPFAGEPFMAAISPLQSAQAAPATANPPCALFPGAAAPAVPAAEGAPEPSEEATTAVAVTAAGSLALSASPAGALPASARAASPAAPLAAAQPALFAGSPLRLAAEPDAEAAAENAPPEPLSQMAPWSPKSAPAWQQSSMPAARALALQSSPPPAQPKAGREQPAEPAKVPLEAQTEELAPASIAASEQHAAAAETQAWASASAPVSPIPPQQAAGPLQPPATAPALGRSLTRQLVRTLAAQRESDQSPRLLLQEAQRHLLQAFEMLPSTSQLSGACSGAAERHSAGRHEAQQDSGSSGSCAGTAGLAPVSSEDGIELAADRSPDGTAGPAAGLDECPSDAEQDGQHAAASEATFVECPVDAEEKESVDTSAGMAVQAEQPGSVAKPAAADSDRPAPVAPACAAALAAATAAFRADCVVAEEGEEEAAHSLEASAAGSSNAVEKEKPAEAASSEECPVQQVANQPAASAVGSAAAAAAEEKEALDLRAASGNALAPAAAVSECSSDGLVADVAAVEKDLEEKAECGQSPAQQANLNASRAVAAATPTAPSALSGSSNNLPAAAPVERCLRASVASSAGSSADGEEGEEEQHAAAAAPDAASLAQPAAAEASFGGGDPRASVSSLASTAGSDEVAAVESWAEGVSTCADVRASAASVGSAAAPSDKGSGAADLTDGLEPLPGSSDGDECSSSCAMAKAAAHAAAGAALAEAGLAPAVEAADTVASVAEEAVEDAGAAVAAGWSALAATEAQEEAAVAAEAEEVLSAEEGEEDAVLAEEDMPAAQAAQLAAAAAEVSHPERVAGALFSPTLEAGGVEDSLDAAVPAVVPGLYPRRQASGESLVLQGSVCTGLQPGRRLPPLPMVDPLAAASDMPSARRQLNSAAAAGSSPARQPAAAVVGVAWACMVSGGPAVQEASPARFPEVDLAAPVSPSFLQPQTAAAGAVSDQAGSAASAPAALTAGGAAQLTAGSTWQWEGVQLAAAASVASSCTEEEAEAGGVGEEAQRSPLLLEQGWLLRSSSPLWGPQEMMEVAAAAAEAATGLPEAAGRAPDAAVDPRAPGPLQGGLQAREQARVVQQLQWPPQPPAAPAGLQALSHAASGGFVTARSRQSDGDGGREQAGEQEVASPGTEPFRHSLAHTPGARVAQEHRPLGAAAPGTRGRPKKRLGLDTSGAPAGSAGEKLASQAGASLHGQKQRILQDQGQAERCSSGIKAAWGQPAGQAAAGEQAGEPEPAEGSPQQGAGSEHQPAALDVGPHGRRRSAAHALHAGHASPDAADAAAVAAVAPAAAGWQWKGLLTPRSCPATELAAEAAAAAAAAATGGPSVQRSPGAASDKKRRQPQVASARAAPSQAAVSRRLHSGGPCSPLVPTGAGYAAAAALFAAAAAAPETPMAPTAVPPSPAQLSPESLQYGRAQPQAASAAQRAPAIDYAGRDSPDSQRFKQHAAQTSMAVSQLQLRRLLSKGQQGMQTAAAQAAAAGEDVVEDGQTEAWPEGQPQLVTPTSRYCPPQQQQQGPAGAETPRGSVVGSAAAGQRTASPGMQRPEQQQQPAPGVPAAVISARLAQAEQLTPISALRALRSSLALMAGPHGAADRGAAWASQQHQMQGILERLEARFKEAREQAQRETELRHELEQQVFVLKQRVEELEGAAEEAETLRLDLMEARREAQELQHRQQRWQGDEAGEGVAAAERQRQQRRREAEDLEGRQRGEREWGRWEEQQAAAAATQRQHAEADRRRMAELLQQQQRRQLQRRQEQEQQELWEAQRAERGTAAAAHLAPPAYPAYPYDRSFRPAIQHNLEKQEAFYYGPRYAAQPLAGAAARPRSAAQAAAAAVAGTLPQQSSAEREPPSRGGSDPTAAADSEPWQRQLPRQYATIGLPAAHAAAALPSRTAGGRQQGSRPPQSQQQVQRKAATLLDAGAFTPLGAGAAGLLRKERQGQGQARHQGRLAGAGYDPRQYHTMF
ncbi:hypothetical protein ABPG77_000294 [Micractinium sp. CCAP 211/92]